MIREDKFLISRRPYAVDLSSWQRSEWKTGADGRQYARQHINAIWFRRKRGVVVAHFGTLWDYSDADNAADMLRLHDDGRYGGHWIAAWDGDGVWSQNVLPKADLDAYAEILDKALVGLLNDKALPAAFDGWYRF